MTTVSPAFLAASDVVDFDHPEVDRLARELARATPRDTAAACFDWVRDRIEHSVDFGREELSCDASEALRLGTGLCIAKSHLLVALWRANGIPSGFCYQRLRFREPGGHYCSHGLVAVWLEQAGWYRCDARGNKATVHCEFTPGSENLAFATTAEGECTFPQIWAQPWPELVERMGQLGSMSGYLARPIDVAPPQVAADQVVSFA